LQNTRSLCLKVSLLLQHLDNLGEDDAPTLSPAVGGMGLGLKNVINGYMQPLAHGCYSRG
jgi:hypothetical protein